MSATHLDMVFPHKSSNIDIMGDITKKEISRLESFVKTPASLKNTADTVENIWTRLEMVVSSVAWATIILRFTYSWVLANLTASNKPESVQGTLAMYFLSGSIDVILWCICSIVFLFIRWIVCGRDSNRYISPTKHEEFDNNTSKFFKAVFFHPISWIKYFIVNHNKLSAHHKEQKKISSKLSRLNKIYDDLNGPFAYEMYHDMSLEMFESILHNNKGK